MKKVYQLERFNNVKFFKDGRLIGSMMCLTDTMTMSYEVQDTNSIFVEASYPNGLFTLFICDKFEVYPDSVRELVFEYGNGEGSVALWK